MAKQVANDMKNDLKKEAQAAVKDAKKDIKHSLLGCIFDAICGCDPFEAVDAAKEVHSAVKGTKDEGQNASKNDKRDATDEQAGDEDNE
jgi:hypothetical protein